MPGKLDLIIDLFILFSVLSILTLIASYWHDKKHKRAVIRLVDIVCTVTIILTEIHLIKVKTDTRASRDFDGLGTLGFRRVIFLMINITIKLLYFKKNAC